MYLSFSRQPNRLSLIPPHFIVSIAIRQKVNTLVVFGIEQRVANDSVALLVEASDEREVIGKRQRGKRSGHVVGLDASIDKESIHVRVGIVPEELVQFSGLEAIERDQ